MGYTGSTQVSYYPRLKPAVTGDGVYIPPPTLILLVFGYLLFLLSADWILQVDGAWYRPFLLGVVIIAAAAWVYREQNSDDL